MFRKSHSDVRGVLKKKCAEDMQQFTGEHPCRSAISIKLLKQLC